VPVKLIDILRSSAAYLGRAEVPRPRLEAEVLMSHVLSVERIQLYLQFERYLGEPELSELRTILRRRARGVPSAYLTGEREFYGHLFAVREGVLIPRPESELVVELALARLAGDQGSDRAADLGTGTGCLGIALALGAPSLRVDAVDISEISVELAGSNAKRLGVSDRFTVTQGSWTDPLLDRGPYRLIVSNPPYVTTEEIASLEPGVRDFEPKLALDAGPDGLATYRELIPKLHQIAAGQASILLEVDPRRAAAVAELAARAWPGIVPSVHRDLAGRDRVVEVTIA
jgi:release factor glutamine methyltransferase